VIRLFNVNNPSVTVFLFIYAVALNLVLFIEPGFFSVPQPQAPFAQLFFYLTEALFGNNHYVLAIIAIIVIFVQALMVNRLVNASKLFDTGTFAPSVIYVTIACLFREFLFLSPALLSLTFVIPALGKSLRFFRQQRCFAEVFDMGFLIAIASLFYKPVFLLIILLFIALAVMRSFNWREWVIGLSGFVTVFFLAGTFYFMIDKLPGFTREFILAPTVIPKNSLESSLSLSVITASTGVLTLVSIVIFLLNYLKSAVLARKFMALSGWAFLLLALSSLFVSGVSVNHFVVLSVPLSIIISYLFISIKRVRIANVIHYLWLAVVLFFQYYKM